MIDVQRDLLRTLVLPDRGELGRVAAMHAAGRLRAILSRQPRARVIFAAAASQAEMLDQLAISSGIDCGLVDAFLLD